tara:strand:- start:775 stop:1737 length:963 start_codon:yes stop_codon:yes gene_type:complete
MSKIITKINGLAYGSINKYAGVAKTSTKKVGGTVNFHGRNAVSKSITAGSDHRIVIGETEDANLQYKEDAAISVSFWIKAGWDTSDNSTIVLFQMCDSDASAYYDDEILLYYYEPHGRIYARFSSSSGNYHRNFWHSENLDPTGSRDYRVHMNASGLGHGGNWNSGTRGTVNSDDYNLLTLTKGTANNALYSNFKLYWNGTDCGYGYYGENASPSGASGTVSMGTGQAKAISLGSRLFDGDNVGNNAETKYMGLTIWNKELSASEVNELYNSGTPMHVGTHSAYANCSGWWPFQDDGTGFVNGSSTGSFEHGGDSNYEAK